MATDAIDHRTFHPDLYDLSGADFEFIGSSDVENPGVPNMINIGVYESWPSEGHGHLLMNGVDIVIVVAEPLDVGSLAVDYVPGLEKPEIHRIPGDKVLNVLTSTMTPEARAGTIVGPALSPACARVPRSPAGTVDRGRSDLYDPAPRVRHAARRPGDPAAH